MSSRIYLTERKSKLQGIVFWGAEVALPGERDMKRTLNEINTHENFEGLIEDSYSVDRDQEPNLQMQYEAVILNQSRRSYSKVLFRILACKLRSTGPYNVYILTNTYT